MSAGVALQAVVTGLAQGAVYGLVALGFTLCYRLVRVLDFAHGDLIVGATFVSVLATVGTTPVLRAPGPGTAILQVVIALLVGGLLGALLYVVAVRPFRNNELGWVAATVTAGLVVREALGLVFTREAYAVADPLRLPTRLVSLPGGGRLPLRLFAVLAIGLAVGLAVERLLVASRLGRAMRAVADDRDAAALMGVPTDRVVLVAFAVAGVLAGVAGLLAAPAGPVTVSGGVILGLKGTAAALLGRLGSLRGALAGGLALGVVESLAVSSTLLGPAYRDVLALAVLVVVLAARPEGLRSRLPRTAG
ncbi:MAG: branched-chain amino acid transport system permease protein [Frankiaceae bacterium]|nr:branched-chain amino acid transport system permease protein [Frankiaceae bacterium]